MIQINAELRKPIVLLDLDDTILDFKKAEAVAVAETFRRLGIEPRSETVARYSEINARQWELLEEGRLTKEQVLYTRFDLLFKELGVSLSGHEAQDIYERLLSQGHFFIPGAEKMLAELQESSQLYLVSNGVAFVQQGRLASAGISKYFNRIFISDEIGFNKPQKEFFDRCFALIEDFERSRAIIIGDSLTSDIRGGINAGIATCWFNPAHKPARADIRADYEADSLSKVSKLIREVFADVEFS